MRKLTTTTKRINVQRVLFITIYRKQDVCEQAVKYEINTTRPFATVRRRRRRRWRRRRRRQTTTTFVRIRLDGNLRSARALTGDNVVNGLKGKKKNTPPPIHWKPPASLYHYNLSGLPWKTRRTLVHNIIFYMMLFPLCVCNNNNDM